ncbi:YtxH domain-containing protein [Conyzicola sp.]|uniref:YtxH domain-containing protein n=1 Tax=Conyzicola sp. TaxID=1969404 RepID=UPI00398A2045
MKGKILLVVGIGVGYVLGARAGRERYEDIKRMAGKFWNDPRVQRQFDDAEGFVKDKTPEVVSALASGAKKVATQVSGRKPRSSPARSTPAQSSAAKSGSSK